MKQLCSNYRCIDFVVKTHLTDCVHFKRDTVVFSVKCAAAQDRVPGDLKAEHLIELLCTMHGIFSGLVEKQNKTK